MEKGLAELVTVARIANQLELLGLRPILVGGMALVLLGSQRVTQDFDFVIAHPRDLIENVVDVFYDRGLELVSKLNSAGEVTATIDNRKVAAARLRIDAPASAFFFHPTKLLRVDLLFDFPIAAAELAAAADNAKIRGHALKVAAAADLLRLKKIAAKQRSFAGDAQDIEFLQAHLRR